MPEYKWALGNGEIVSADYNRTADTLTGEQVRSELLTAFQQFGHAADCTPVHDTLPEIYQISFANPAEPPVIVCAKATTPGGRSNLNDEQRVQQKSRYINYAVRVQKSGEPAIHLGVYKRDNQTIFCAWKLKESAADPDTTISRQIKISTIASAMKEGFVQQIKGPGEFACAFRKEFIYFYLRNANWLHDSLLSKYFEEPASPPDGTEPSAPPDWGRLLSLENQEFVTSCLDLLKQYGLFNETTLSILESREQCASMFRHNSLHGILLQVDPEKTEDEQCKDANGQRRYYINKYDISGESFFVSSQWYTEARRPFVEWIASLLSQAGIETGAAPTPPGIQFHTGYTSQFARNRILFGAPGTGKSFTLNREKDRLLSDGGAYERVTFHPDYSYANFVGTYKPVPCQDSDGTNTITYKYVPGPFMRTYMKALKNSTTSDPKPFLLIIEEMNRANVAAVFGEVFQLLDRGDDEASEYPIQASEDIKQYLMEELGGDVNDYAEIRIPDNMFIWATMNSADQGVFPLDTAFKRRWDFTYLGIDHSESGISGKTVILGQGAYRRVVEWNALRRAINNELLSYRVNEDKLMGPYFISRKNLPEGPVIDPESFIPIFQNKVIMYLFDDAAKQKRPTLFSGCAEASKNQYSKICEEFETKGVSIFCESIRNQFIDLPDSNVPEGDGE